MKISKINYRIIRDYIKSLTCLWYTPAKIKDILDRVGNTFYKTIKFISLTCFRIIE